MVVEAKPLANKIINYNSSEFQLSKVPEEKNLQNDLKLLRKLISGDDKLKCPMDDEFLSMFIRGRKYDVERAFKSIKCFFKLWSTSPEYLGFGYPTAVADIFLTPDFFTVSKYRINGAQIVILRLALWNTASMDPDQLLVAMFLTGLHAIRSSSQTNILGLQIIIDAEGFSFRHLRFMTPSRIYKVLTMLQDGFPVRIKGIHVLNNHYIIQLTYELLKPLLKEKMRKRITFHGKNYKESLCQALSEETIPQSYGGSIPDEDYRLTEFYPELLTQDDHYKFITENEYGYGHHIG